MEINKEFNDGVLTVTLGGKLDTTTTPNATEEIKKSIDSADKLILDIKDVSYISSAGLRLLLSLHKKMAEKGGMVVKNANETNMEIFEFTGFAGVLNFE